MGRQTAAGTPAVDLGMVAIQLVDLVVGKPHLAGSVPLSLSGFPMFNALWISAGWPTFAPSAAA